MTIDFAPGWEAFWLKMRRMPLDELLTEASAPEPSERSGRHGNLDALVRESRDVLPKITVQRYMDRAARAAAITKQQTKAAERMLGLASTGKDAA
ncbi:hypothetical protein [Agrococcus sp. Marseille-Q4369]|uniref:hypothetical protein n=1 Tax=Agrococcus sp. Marseille-Q4369 TaxID=2810513 RepID=UPI001B8B1228|nr:hypothetical protein [Agrococcus sp. Marseille-Q4369]QUW18874.1 hypothetical protein JSQ78_00360 [Agrococcus sp. Marseille-Q4369]